MKLYFAGAEAPSHLETLRACGVSRVAVNITMLARRRSAKKPLLNWATKDRLGDMEWLLYADSPVTPWFPALELLSDAEVQPEMLIGPASWWDETNIRNTDVWFVPTWDGQDRGILRSYVESFEGLFLPDPVVDNTRAVGDAQAALRMPPQGFLGAITGRSRGINRFDGVISSAWWAAAKYGETQVWAANRMNRLSAEDKLAKRRKYETAVEALGVDFGALLADDPKAVAELAIRSWQKMEESLPDRHPQSEVDNPPETGAAKAVQTSSVLANPPLQGRHGVLPTMGFETTTTKRMEVDDSGVEHEVVGSATTLAIPSGTVRKCDSCYLASYCPSFQPGNPCAYSIPVTIRTKDQLHDVLRAMLEIQGQRVLLMRFAEEVRGEPEPEVGKEMDRLFALTHRLTEIEDTRDTFKMSVEAKAGAGTLSRLFGSKVGQNARKLDVPVSSTEVMQDATGN